MKGLVLTSYPELKHRATLTVFLVAALFSYDNALAQWSIPDELQTQASVLTELQLEFISSGTALKFIPEQQLKHEIATRDANMKSPLEMRTTCACYSMT